MNKNGRMLLIAAGSMSAIIALLHVCILLVGEPGYRYFAGIGDQLADLLVDGSWLPSLLVIISTLVFVIFAIYAFSGGGCLPKLPFLHFVLLAIGVIYLVRGIMNIPFYLIVLIKKLDITNYQSFLFDSISFVIGLFYLLGTKFEWERLKPHEP
jgi:hypothetical protein